MEKLDISVLGLPPNKEKQLRSKKIEDLYTLVHYTPIHYFNMEQKNVNIGAITMDYVGKIIEIIGKIENVQSDGWNGKVTAVLSDGTGKIKVTWFNQPYLANSLHVGLEYSIVGKVNEYFGHFSIQAPISCSSDPRDFHRIVPQYTAIRGMSQDYIQSCIHKSIDEITIMGKDYLTDEEREMLDVPSDIDMISYTHFPTNTKEIAQASRRYVVDNLYPFAAHMAYKQRYAAEPTHFFITKTEQTEKFIQNLPFSLTPDQKSAVDKLLDLMRNGVALNALVQGDVGCGKTIVAVILAVAMKENGYQTAIMAPTGVLAEQHYNEFNKFGLEPVLLTGKMKAKERREAYAKIKTGQASIIVGTHALLSDKIEFKQLAMVVVDEEHRFGVAQREKLMEHTSANRLHKVSMSATPIPRSLAGALYGKGTQFMDIHSMPSGRKPTVTCLCHSHKMLFEGLVRQVHAGRQCYIVCPFIEDSSSDAMSNIVSAETCYAEAVQYMAAHSDIKVAKISGKMKPKEIEEEIAKFARNETQILISTTIVEVGVNVPNASVMVIENAERFGLAQLHQLRGRVGRGSHQGYCVLMTGKENRDNERLQVMLSTTDGFKIAEADAKNRGIGDLSGEEQTGFSRIMELIGAYPHLYKKIEESIDSVKRTEKDWEELFDIVDDIQYLTRSNYATNVAYLKDA